MFSQPKCIKLTRNLHNKTSQNDAESAIVFTAPSSMESDLCLSSRYSNFLIPATLNKIRIMSRDAFLCVVMEPTERESFVHCEFPPDWHWSMLNRMSAASSVENGGKKFCRIRRIMTPLSTRFDHRITVTEHNPRFDTAIHENYYRSCRLDVSQSLPDRDVKSSGK